MAQRRSRCVKVATIATYFNCYIEEVSGTPVALYPLCKLTNAIQAKEDNMKTITMLFVVSLLGLTACDEGPAEEMGRNIDNAATDARNAIEDACEKVKDGVNADNTNC